MKPSLRSTICLVGALSLGIILVPSLIENNPSLVLAQQTNTSSSTSMQSGLIPNNNTIIGNAMIPSNTNGTTTTAKNATGTNAIGVSPALLASNVTAANAFTKENTTAPVSPTGISTNAAHAPHSARGNASGVNSTLGLK
jgi:cytoskeletal protein RodZ